MVVDNLWYLLFSFCANAGTAVHMVFGIGTLGSVQLVGAADAGTIIARFLASALVCRCDLMFELAGLASVWKWLWAMNTRVIRP
jgi:hypothetical protein